MNDLPWLSLLMVVPLTGAAVVAVLPSSSAALARPIALGSALVTLVLGIIATATSFTRGSTIALLLTVICLLVTVFIFRSSRRDLTKG